MSDTTNTNKGTDTSTSQNTAKKEDTAKQKEIAGIMLKMMIKRKQAE